jgi:uncharacterized membrane protein YidH (DUF202 family)
MRSRELSGSGGGGAPRERTGLAWQRSAFSYVALSGLVLGIAARHDVPGLLAVSVALIAVAAAVWRHGRDAYEEADVTAHPRALAIMSAVTALSALVAAVVVLVRL